MTDSRQSPVRIPADPIYEESAQKIERIGREIRSIAFRSENLNISIDNLKTYGINAGITLLKIVDHLERSLALKDFQDAMDRCPVPFGSLVTGRAAFHKNNDALSFWSITAVSLIAEAAPHCVAHVYPMRRNFVLSRYEPGDSAAEKAWHKAAKKELALRAAGKPSSILPRKPGRMVSVEIDLNSHELSEANRERAGSWADACDGAAWLIREKLIQSRHAIDIVLPEKQRKILDMLNGRALVGKELIKEICGRSVKDTSRFRRDHIKPLMESGRIQNDRLVGGYFRNTSPSGTRAFG